MHDTLRNVPDMMTFVVASCELQAANCADMEEGPWTAQALGRCAAFVRLYLSLQIVNRHSEEPVTLSLFVVEMAQPDIYEGRLATRVRFQHAI